VIGPKGRSWLTRVSSLLDQHGNWNEALVHKTFSAIDSNLIMRIKIFSRRLNDFLAWQPEKNCIFSVRTAYRIGLRLVHKREQLGQQYCTAG
jgi:hypothetical protein